MFQVGFHLVRGAGSQCCLGAGASRPRPSPRPCLGKRKLLQIVSLKGWFALTFPALENVAKRLEQTWRCLFLFFLFFLGGGHFRHAAQRNPSNWPTRLGPSAPRLEPRAPSHRARPEEALWGPSRIDGIVYPARAEA